MISLRIKYSDANVKKYLRNAERTLKSSTYKTLNRIGDLAFAIALFNAPLKDGFLRSSIIKRAQFNDKIGRAHV